MPAARRGTACCIAGTSRGPGDRQGLHNPPHHHWAVWGISLGRTHFPYLFMVEPRGFCALWRIFQKKRTPSTSDEAPEEAGGHQFPPPLRLRPWGRVPGAAGRGGAARDPRSPPRPHLRQPLRRRLQPRRYPSAPPSPRRGGGWVGESGDTAGEKDGDAMVRAPPPDPSTFRRTCRQVHPAGMRGEDGVVAVEQDAGFISPRNTNYLSAHMQNRTAASEARVQLSEPMEAAQPSQ